MSAGLQPDITIAATPIGNLQDASLRLIAALGEAEVIAAEDTRRLRNLATALQVPLKAKIISNHEHNERARIEELLAAAQAGTRVLVVSDAGMPTIADPGFPLAAAAAEAGIEVHVIPGPSAVTSALAVSGLPTDSFTFLGFVPRKGKARSDMLQTIATSRHTVVAFEAPTRLAATLSDLAAACGQQRQCAVSRELTKLHEETLRGSLGELASWAAGGVRGEIVLVIAPAPATPLGEVDPKLVAEVRALADLGLRLKVAAQHVAARTGVRAKSLFEAAHH